MNTKAKLYNSSDYSTIQTHGTLDTTVVNVKGGVVENATGIAIYFANGKELNLTGGEVTGTTAVAAKGGKVTIGEGVILHGVGEKYDPSEADSSGSNDTGDAFYVEDNYTPAVTATITGGKFISDNAKAVNILFKQESKGSTISITGGKFSSDPNEFCADGYCALLNDDGMYHIVEGRFVSDRAELVAAVNGTYSTIYLKNDIIANNSVSFSRTVTLDLNGFTLTRDNYSNSDANLFNFDSNSGIFEVTIRNGTLKRITRTTGDTGAIAVVAPSTKLNLSNVTLIGHTPNGYLITTNGNQTTAAAEINATNCDFIMYYGSNSKQICGTAIYLPAGNLVLNNCNMLAPNCLVISGGSAKINGGTYVATSAHSAYQNTKYETNQAAKNFMGNHDGCWAFGDAIQIQTYRSTTNYKLSSVEIDGVTTVCLGNGAWGTYGIRVLDLDKTVPDAANQVTIGAVTYCTAEQTGYKYDETKSFAENIAQLRISTLADGIGRGGINRDPAGNS